MDSDQEDTAQKEKKEEKEMNVTVLQSFIMELNGETIKAANKKVGSVFLDEGLNKWKVVEDKGKKKFKLVTKL